MYVSLLALVFLALWLSPLQRGVEREVLAACRGDLPACVSMTLDASPLQEILASRAPEDSAGWTSFHLKVRGRLNDGSSEVTPLVVRGYTAGMECSVFGQAKAAVIGFSNKQEPIILTTSGPFVVEDRTFEVGCPGCAVLLTRERYDTVAVLTTPAWDAALLGYSWAALRTYDDAGNLYLDTGGACIQIRPRQRFRRVDRKRCNEMVQVGDYTRPVPGLDFEPTEILYEVPGARYVLFLARGACT
jgi:hypothetical protein